MCTVTRASRVLATGNHVGEDQPRMRSAEQESQRSRRRDAQFCVNEWTKNSRFPTQPG